MTRRRMQHEAVALEALATMQKSGGTWAAYECHALDSAEVGALRFLAYGKGKTFEKAPERFPDSAHGPGWKYVHVGYVNLETGQISEDEPLFHWRVTRPSVYDNPNCPGHTDKSARQGYYVDARDEEHAREVARQNYAGKIKADEPLDVQRWR